METRREKRINKLAQALKKADKLHLKDAAQLLGVSEMTVRRDLNTRPDSVLLLGGYVVNGLKNNSPSRYFVSEQQTKHAAEKRIVGEIAASLIEANDTVFFDCGTTTSYIIEAIPHELPFTSICYSLNTFLALQEKPNNKVILCGGEFHPDSAIFTPLSQYNGMDHICPNKAFISAAGIDLDVGATCFNFAELSMKHRALAMSQRAILVVDSRKFDQRKPAHIGPFSLFDTLITDRQPTENYTHYCSNNGIVLLTQH
ncbi:DNA-binding transcriptional repressor DeoR [Pectobacteriaceae bacterium CE90]|nr:DNA-binding transcriptional repressor DeoR [Prodigiosinella sp. LS101]WJV55495.1 DNA-binding transcriptional repressor DeoR [Prodigiosinella sp. LS101]WJV59856.1 DNA-binding transcriptional repressor DeoR [Pectobacteriaceae bacterium C111]WJY13450.1 DNA-binding transcriptional repressor DeoR [Pectobacteriaceae bacterium CE90]